MKSLRICLLVCLVSVLAWDCRQLKSRIPVDIPGTNVNFFLYRYTGDEVPTCHCQIWKNLSDVFIEWASQGADPTALTSDDVTVATVGDVVGIYLKGRLIVEVDEFHAQANYATRLQLADMWAANLKKGVDIFVDLNKPL